MRITLSLFVWLVFVGGLVLYMQTRGVTLQATGPGVEIQAAEGNYGLEITTTFTVEPDPFGLQTDEGEEQPALVVKLGEREILRKTDILEAGIPLRVEPLQGLVEGTNEIYLEASPPLEQIDKSNGVRVQVFQGGQSIAEHTFWSVSGQKVADTMRFTLAPSQNKVKTDEHE